MPTSLSLNHLSRRGLSAALMVLLIAATGGCKTFSDFRQSEDLDRTLKGYERAMRWSDIPAALSLHKFPDDQPLPLPEDYEDYQIIGYDLIYAPVQTDPDTTLQTVKIQYLIRATQQVRSVNNRQEWKYDEATKRWAVVTPFPLPARPRADPDPAAR